MSEKYGRLFTENDVLAIVDEALGADYDSPALAGKAMGEILDVLIDRAEKDKAPMRFPADEPLFLLRGQDALAPHVVRQYALLANDPVSVGEAHRRAAFAAADEMREWQAQHPERVKVPD